MRRIVTVVLGLALAALPACDQRVQSLSEYEEAKAKTAAEQVKTAAQLAKVMSLPLPTTGPNSEEKLHQDLSKLPSESAKTHYERAYRLVFTQQREQRNPDMAMDELREVVREAPRFAPAFRVAAYASFLQQDAGRAQQYYQAAIGLDPDYGDAHFGLALILAMPWDGADTASAKAHLERATALGVMDTVGLKEMLAQMPERKPAAREMPEGHPPTNGVTAAPGPAADVPMDGEAIPLKLTGIGSAQELERATAKLRDAALQKSLDKAFRYTFSPKTQFRDRAAAKAEFEKVIAGDPNCAAAYRGLAYVLFDSGQADESVANYTKALALDPDYGEAHYALSFIQAAGAHAEGLEHFKRAMALGVPDERKLGERFYPEAK